jgi:hypothetical protein
MFRGLTLDEAKRSGTALGLTLLPVEIRTLEDLEGAFSTMTRERADEHERCPLPGVDRT